MEIEDRLTGKVPHVPTEERAVARLRRVLELGELEDLKAAPHLLVRPRYLVTYMQSVTSNDDVRSATVVSVTNQGAQPNFVVVRFYKGFTNDSSPVGSAAFSIPSQFTIDFSTRHLPIWVTTTNSVPNPELTFDEGRAIVLSSRPKIGVSARVYYTGPDDGSIHAVTDSKVVVYGEANVGD